MSKNNYTNVEVIMPVITQQAIREYSEKFGLDINDTFLKFIKMGLTCEELVDSGAQIEIRLPKEVGNNILEK